jgi:hypothetical protein
MSTNWKPAEVLDDYAGWQAVRETGVDEQGNPVTRFVVRGPSGELVGGIYASAEAAKAVIEKKRNDDNRPNPPRGRSPRMR